MARFPSNRREEMVDAAAAVVTASATRPVGVDVGDVVEAIIDRNCSPGVCISLKSP